MTLAVSLTLLAAASTLATPSTEDWPHFRGPGGLGISSGSLPDSFDRETNMVWRTELPIGYSSPTVLGDQIFVTASDKEYLFTICIDRETGEELWRGELEYSGQRTGANTPAAATPVTDGEFVFCLFHDFGIVAYDLEGGEIWVREMGPFAIPHGMSSSPVLHDEALILQVDQDSGSSLIALETIDGEIRWEVERKGFTHSYATPAIYTPEDGPAEVIVSGSFRIAGYSLEDGEERWSVDGACFMTKGIPLVCGDRCYVCAYAAGTTESGLPRVTQTFQEALAEKDADGDGKISMKEFDNQAMNQAWAVFDLNDDLCFDERDWEYITASNKPTGGLFSIRLGGEGDITKSHVEWKYDGRRGLPDVSTPVVMGDALFAVKTGGLLTSFDLETGDVVKMERIGDPDRYFASPVGAGDRILLASLSGQLTVVKAAPEWEVISVSDLEEELWSTPALADDHVYIRTQKALYSFDTSTSE